ncbi:MAG: hypothetical protein ACK5DD_05615 [Cyclobacteriaceae bacterium]
MKKSLLVGTMLSAFVFMLLLSTESYAQKEITASKVEKSRGASQRALPDDSKPTVKPDKSRGSCCLEFDNYTGYYIDVWVDNAYRGRVAPWDLGSICVGNGYTTWYAETAGGTYSWSDSGQCNSVNLSYRLK